MSFRNAYMLVCVDEIGGLEKKKDHFILTRNASNLQIRSWGWGEFRSLPNPLFYNPSVHLFNTHTQSYRVNMGSTQ